MSKSGSGVIKVIGIAMGIFHLYTAYSGTLHPFIQRSIHLVFLTVLAFLAFPARKASSSNDGIPLYDWFLASLALPVFGYIALRKDYIVDRWPMTPSFPLSPLEIILAVLAIVLLFEATRRVMGWPLIIVAVCMLLYSYLGGYIEFSTVLRHRGFNVMEILDYMYMTNNGIWGVAIGVSATYMVLFIIFGSFVEKSGAADFFIEFATSIAGHTRGGAAKVSIFSSALVGSVTGSTVANVYTTGAFTIPMMKRLGYRSPFAGAIESLASNGGQLMPPILGAAAFIMSAYTGVPYIKIALASLIPALLYFGGLFFFIHFEAVKIGLTGVPKDQKPSIIGVLKKGGHLLTPLIALIVMLMYGVSPIRAAFFAILLTIAVSWVRKDTRMSVKDIIIALAEGAKNSVMIGIVCAVIGYIIGGFTLTGLGLNLSSAIVSWSGGIFFLSLVFIGVSCLILGMGMNTVAAYLLVSVIAVPALTMQGVDILVANMYVFYFSLLSHITPPVCLAVYAGAQVAEANIWKTAGLAVKMGLIGYLLPFVIIYRPSLLVLGSSAQEVLLSLVVASVGVLFLVAGIQGWLINRQTLLERVLCIGSGVLLLWPKMIWNIVGAVVIVGAVLINLAYAKGHRVEQQPDAALK